jgi:repressor LexA
VQKSRPAWAFSTASSAEDHLQALAKGALEITPRRARPALEGHPRHAAAGNAALVGRVAAGSPILAAEHIEAQYRIDATLFEPHADYPCCACAAPACRTSDPDGDLLVVHKSARARSGQIVVARWAKWVTVKRLKRRGREITLVAENRRSRRSSSIRKRHRSRSRASPWV